MYQNLSETLENVCRFSRLIEISGVLKVVPDDADDNMVLGDVAQVPINTLSTTD